MTETKKTETKEIVKASTVKTEEKIPAASAGDKAPAAEAKASAKAPVKKTTAKKETAAKPPVKKTASKAAAKETAVKEPAAKPAKSTASKAKAAPAAAAKDSTASVVVQFSGKSYSTEDLVKIVQDIWKYDLNQKPGDFKNVELYVKPEESSVYYVINGETTGSFTI